MCVIAMDKENIAILAINHVPNACVIDGDICHVNESNIVQIVTNKDWLLIWLSEFCCESNAPLYLADEIVEIFIMWLSSWHFPHFKMAIIPETIVYLTS